MLSSGIALKVTVHLNDDTAGSEGSLHEQILAYLQRQGIEGATVLRPHAGYGSHRKLHTHGAGSVAGEHLPILFLFVEETHKARVLLPDLLAMVTDGLVEAHQVEVLKNISAPEKVIR
jgi:uncharacterized protein